MLKEAVEAGNKIKPRSNEKCAGGLLAVGTNGVRKTREENFSSTRPPSAKYGKEKYALHEVQVDLRGRRRVQGLWGLRELRSKGELPVN